MSDTKGYAGSVNPWSILVVFAVLITAHIALVFFFGIDDYRSLIVNDVFLPIESLCALAAVWYGARRTSTRDAGLARAWYVITFALLAWFLGEATWTFIELVLKQDPFPSIADVFYLLYYPLFVIGIILIPRTPLKDINRSEYLTYAGLFITSLSLAFIYLLIYPLFSVEYTNYPVFVFSILYPICDLLQLNTTLALFLLMLRRQPSAPIWCLMISVVLMTITDSTFGYQEINESYTGGNLIDVGWSVSLAFLAIAGAFQARAIGRSS